MPDCIQPPCEIIKSQKSELCILETCLKEVSSFVFRILLSRETSPNVSDPIHAVNRTKALPMPGMYSTTELHPNTFSFLVD